MAAVISRIISTQKVISFLLKDEVNRIERLCSKNMENGKLNEEGSTETNKNSQETAEEVMEEMQEGKERETKWDNIDLGDKCTHARCKILVIGNIIHETNDRLKHQ